MNTHPGVTPVLQEYQYVFNEVETRKSAATSHILEDLMANSWDIFRYSRHDGSYRRIHSASRHALLTVAIMICNGCVPYPHEVVRVPEIRLTLLKNGVAVQGAKVLVSNSLEYDAPCKGASVIGTTDENGQFPVASRVDVDFFYSFLNPPDTVGQLNTFCFQSPGETILFGGQFLIRQNTPSKIFVVCDPSLPKVRSSISGEQMCR